MSTLPIGCIALSTWVPLGADYPAALSTAAKTMAIFQAHGSADQVVNFAWGRASHVLLKEMIPSPEPHFMSIKGMGHSSHPEEIGNMMYHVCIYINMF
jgi:predicted esterase